MKTIDTSLDHNI